MQGASVIWISCLRTPRYEKRDTSMDVPKGNTVKGPLHRTRFRSIARSTIDAIANPMARASVQHLNGMVFSVLAASLIMGHGNTNVWWRINPVNGCGLMTKSRVKIARSTTLRSGDRKSTRLNSSHVANSYAVFCLKKQK